MRKNIFLITGLLMLLLPTITLAEAEKEEKEFSCSRFGNSNWTCKRKLSEKARKWCLDDLNGVSLSCDEADCGVFTCTVECRCRYWPDDEAEALLLLDLLMELE